MKHNLLSILGLGTLLVIAGCMVYIFYLLFEPFKTPTITTPIPILNKDRIIPSGDSISTRVDYCVFKQVPVYSTRRYQSIGGDSRVYFLSSQQTSGVKPGCASATSNTATIPKDIPPGRYKIILDSTFRVNQLKSVTRQYETEEFTIVEATPAGGVR